MRAASSTSTGRPSTAANRIRNTNGTQCHTSTTITDISASDGDPSQFTGDSAQRDQRLIENAEVVVVHQLPHAADRHRWHQDRQDQRGAHPALAASKLGDHAARAQVRAPSRRRPRRSRTRTCCAAPAEAPRRRRASPGCASGSTSTRRSPARTRSSTGSCAAGWRPGRRSAPPARSPPAAGSHSETRLPCAAHRWRSATGPRDVASRRYSGSGGSEPVRRPFLRNSSSISLAAELSALPELISPITAWLRRRPRICSTCAPSA